MKLVVVESPAKAKTLEKYLGPGYRVLASYGHVRDLPPKDGSVDPDDGFAMLAKLSFVTAVAVLFAQGRIAASVLGLPAIDLIIAIAFAAVWLQMRREPSMHAEKA